MKHAFRVALSALVFILFFNERAAAQLPTTPKYEIGLNAGTFIYQGDLTPSAPGLFKTPSFALGVNISRWLTGKFAARLDLSFGSLRGDDARYSSPEWRRQRAFVFTTPVMEVTASLLYHPLGVQRKFSPYLFAGLGVSFLSISRDYSGYNAAYFSEEGVSEGLQQDLSQTMPRALPVLPVGIGVRYPLSEKFFLNTEASYRLMRSDYLDGFSQSANPGRKDHYHKFSIGLGYRLGVKDKYACPDVRF